MDVASSAVGAGAISVASGEAEGPLDAGPPRWRSPESSDGCV